MVAKTTMNGDEGMASMKTGATRIARELGELAELEVRLLAADAREARRKIVPGAAMIVIAIAGLLAALPILMAAAAWALADATGWSLASCLALVGLGGIAAAAVTAWLGWGRIVAGISTFKRSQQEFVATMQCLRRSLGAFGDRES